MVFVRRAAPFGNLTVFSRSKSIVTLPKISGAPIIGYWPTGMTNRHVSRPFHNLKENVQPKPSKNGSETTVVLDNGIRVQSA